MLKQIFYKGAGSIFIVIGLVTPQTTIAQSTQKIISGYSHTLAIDANGNLSLWGGNSQGQLGNGGIVDFWFPINVSGFTNVKDAAAGNQHSIAVKNDGTVWAWGANSNGELGDGTVTQRFLPVQVGILSNVNNVGAGYSHSLAIKIDGTLWAWGGNSSGQLGNGTTFNSVSAIQVSGISGVKVVDGGLNFSVALKSDSTVWTWGSDSDGQLGNDLTSQSKSTPVPVQGTAGTKVVAIAAGKEHVLVLRNDSTVWAWGRDNEGQLGNDLALSNKATPVKISSLSKVISISAGEYHSLAVKADGSLWAWGRNTEGQLGIGNTVSPQPVPIQVGTLNGWNTIAAGGNYTLAVKSNKSVWGWGSNENGQIGNAGNVNSLTPASSLFTLANKVSQPAFSVEGGTFLFPQRVKITCATPGAVIRYTTNGNDPTTNDPTINSGGAVKISNGITRLKAKAFKTGEAASDIKSGFYIIGEKISAGYSFSLTIKSDTMLWVWGSNSEGQLANSITTIDKLIPIKLTNISGLSDAGGGFQHTVALKKDGTVWAWGRNSEGQLGDATTTKKTSPVKVVSLSGVSNVAAGYYHSLAIKSDGTVWAWGKNDEGDLGNGNTFPSTTPVQVSNISGVTDITAGEKHSVALRNDGSVWCWGDNSNHKLGDGTTISRSTPVQAGTGLTNIVAIAAGRNHTLALRSDGTVWSWGGAGDLNSFGQLGRSGSEIPGQVTGITNIVAISAGEYHSLALKDDGTIWTWGHNTDGQLGNGSIINQGFPVQVVALNGASAITGGGTHSLAITLVEEGRLFWAWGNNEHGQLGDSTLSSKYLGVLIHFPHDENGNGIADWAEVEQNNDQDGLIDWQELMIYGTDPANFDTNGDGLADGVGVFIGLSPLSADTDDDGISNEQETLDGTSAVLNDSDGDGVQDNADDFPTDPTRTDFPPPNPSDFTPPVITLQQPPDAIIIE